MSINFLVADGVVKSPALRFASDGKAEYRFTLEQADGEFRLWLPCFAPGAAGERLHEQLDEGAHILITSGKLAYRRRQTKLGEQSRLEILVWTVERLSGGEEAMPAAKPRRRPYPKAALSGGFEPRQH